jgi:hypothetical protein
VRFADGASIVRRDMLDGKVWSAGPHRVLADDGVNLRLAFWPGVVSLAPTSWTDWLLGAGDDRRKQALPDLASGRWELGRWTWRDTIVLTWVGVDPDFSLQRFAGSKNEWKVNFERPHHRTGLGIDTFDLMLDLTADPDTLAWSWKDEDEYAQARALGLVGDAEHRRVERARERAVAFIESGRDMLAQDWDGWRPEPDWPLPSMPAETFGQR